MTLCIACHLKIVGVKLASRLDHPHGQIYSLSCVANGIKIQADAMAKSNPLSGLYDTIDDVLILDKADKAISYVPRWGRYPFETWVMPKRMVDGLKIYGQMKS